MAQNEIGTTGLRFVAGGTLQEEVNPKLAGRGAIEIYKEMSENDPVVASILYSIDGLIRGVKWDVEQGEASEEDVEFLEGCMQDMSHSWSDLMSEIMSMMRFGWTYHEIVYKRRQGPQPEHSKVPASKFSDGKIGWRKIPIRSQDTLDSWDIDEDTGALRGMIQMAPPKYEAKPIPITKSLLFRTSVYKNNPEGRSVLRGAYRPWYFKKRVEEIEGVGIERDLAGFPVFEIPGRYLSDTATDAEKAFVARLEEVGKNLRRDKQESLIWPKAYDQEGNEMFVFKLMTSGGSRQFDTSAVIQRYDQRIAMVVLADFILLGHEKVGSFALSSDKTDLFAVALGAVLDAIEDVFNRFAVPRLWRMNGWDESKAPKIRHADIEDPELDKLAAFIQTMSGVGMQFFPDDDFDQWVRTTAHLPEKSEEAKQQQEEAKQQQQAATEGGAQEDEDGTLRFDGGGAGAGQGQPSAGGQPTGG